MQSAEVSLQLLDPSAECCPQGYIPTPLQSATHAAMSEMPSYKMLKEDEQGDSQGKVTGCQSRRPEFNPEPHEVEGEN